MTPQTTEVLTAPEPQPVVPLDPPVVYYNVKLRVPPLVVNTQQWADSLDPAEWTPNPPATPAVKSEYPKLMVNINVIPKIVDNALEEAALPSDWREFPLPQDLVTAAQAKLDAAKK